MSNPPTLKPGQYLGLFKFFRERAYLDRFLDGLIYCNTPEYYRLSAEKGVADRNESCLISFRRSRGDSLLDLEIDGQAAGKASEMIVRSGRKEGWIHCWAHLHLPETDLEFQVLQSDFARLKSEFGPYFAYLTAENTLLFLERLRTLDVPLEAKSVEYYSGGYLGHSIFYKNVAYRYQREYRVVFDFCQTTEIAHREYRVEGGFRDIAKDCPEIKLLAHTNSDSQMLAICA